MTSKVVTIISVVVLVVCVLLQVYYALQAAWMHHIREKHLKWFNRLHIMHDMGDVPGPDWMVTAKGFDADIQAKSPLYWLKHWRDDYPSPTVARYGKGVWGDTKGETKPWH